MAIPPGKMMEENTLLSVRAAQKRLTNGATQVGGFVALMELMKMALLIGR